MLTLQLDLSQTQARALSHVVKQIPAHHIRECADEAAEAEAMREALDAIRQALVEHSF